MPIGGVVGLNNAIGPNLVGKDIACGMLACKLNLKAEELKQAKLKGIIDQIKRDIPMGIRHRDKNDTKFQKETDKLIDKYLADCEDKGVLYHNHVLETDVAQQAGTLGGGNHFIEIQKDENDNIWVMIHSGSRNVGSVFADFHHKVAVKMCDEYKTPIPDKEVAVLPIKTVEAKQYLCDMEFCVQFSFVNRWAMLQEIAAAFEKVLRKEVEGFGSDVLALSILRT